MKAASLFPMSVGFRGLVAPVSALIAAIAWLTLATAAAQLVPPDADDGKTQIEYPDEPFKNFSANENGVSFVKFSILLNDPNTVYFQDSEKPERWLTGDQAYTARSAPSSRHQNQQTESQFRADHQRGHREQRRPGLSR